MQSPPLNGNVSGTKYFTEGGSDEHAQGGHQTVPESSSSIFFLLWEFLNQNAPVPNIIAGLAQYIKAGQSDPPPGGGGAMFT